MLKHVSSQEERRAAEEVANQRVCKDFDRFKPLFEQAEKDLQTGLRQSRPFGKDASIATDDFFILGGQLVYVAEIGETIKAPNGESDARLRAIYSNGTESNPLRRSLQRALYKDEAGRLINPNLGPLFSHNWEKDDIESGTIYVLRSLSDHPFVAEHRELTHKIGVTGGNVERPPAWSKSDLKIRTHQVRFAKTRFLSVFICIHLWPFFRSQLCQNNFLNPFNNFPGNFLKPARPPSTINSESYV